MSFIFRRRALFLLLAILAMVAVFHLVWEPSSLHSRFPDDQPPPRRGFFRRKFKWKNLPQQHPVESYAPMPNGPIASIPQIQADFPPETDDERHRRRKRLRAVKNTFLHSWEGYKRNAWMQDEVAPLTGLAYNQFGGWGATLVDSLDTLWIMGLRDEFALAVSEVRKIDFTHTPLDTLNVFETTIRYLGGLLSAYDVSGHKYKVLLKKAVELGDMLYVAFDTPNRMPVTRWDWRNAAEGGGQEADMHALLAELGSMTLEFTRLSQLTGDDKWYDATARVTNVLHGWQNSTRIPGLWPIMLDAKTLSHPKDITFTMGGMADSLYEYFPKQHLMLGGRKDQYREMYEVSLEAAKRNLFFQPLNPNNDKMLIAGTLKRNSGVDIKLEPQGQHLTCFAGGMVALAAKVFQQTHELETARQLVDGCIWAYESMPSGIMPEIFTAAPCGGESYQNCTWSKANWYEAVDAHIQSRTPIWDHAPEAQQVIDQKNLPPGMVDIPDSRYNLRPEAIESIFVLYRITGDKTLQEQAWKMFQTINNKTRTAIAHASIEDVTAEHPVLADSMESFWTAETLKYFYLIFSEPDVISLDDYILNTEAHPLLRPK